MRFVLEQENNRPEKGSFIHLATNFQRQVQIIDTTQENNPQAHLKTFQYPSPRTIMKTQTKSNP